MEQLRFEWDYEKAKINLTKHGVSFDEAITVFYDPNSITILDSRHDSETRFIDLGLSSTGRILVVVYTERVKIIRLISCRRATKKEIKSYEQE